MKILGNILWIIFGGFFTMLYWYVIGAILCITLIGIPFGKVCFRIGTLSLAPFGREVKTNFDQHPIANVLWLLIAGWELAIGYLTMTVVFAITIIGLPFAKQSLKLMQVALFPFGAKI